MKALIVDRISPLVKKGLVELGVETDVEILPGAERLKKLMKEYDLLVMRVDPKIDAAFLDEAAGRVKMIAICSAGTNHIDLNHAKELGIYVQNAPGLNSNAVAELTISKMLDLSRMTVEANREVQEEGIWNKYKYTGHELRGHVLGIVGIGKIGTRVAHLANAFGMEVLAYDPYVSAEEVKERGGQKVETLDELVSRSDFITVHTPLTDETRGMISDHEFSLMKDGVIAINCARGGIIDEAAALLGVGRRERFGQVACGLLQAQTDRVIGKPFRRGRELQQLILVHARSRGEAHDLEAPVRERAGLVEYDAIGARHLLKIARALHEDAAR